MNYFRKILFSGIFLIAMAGMHDRPAAWATDPINTDAQGVAIEGYDPVAYFTQDKPIKGTDEFTFTWMGAEWRFAGAEHLELFATDPEKYAPRYGGY